MCFQNRQTILSKQITTKEPVKGVLMSYTLTDLRIPLSYEVSLAPISSFGTGNTVTRTIQYSERKSPSSYTPYSMHYLRCPIHLFFILKLSFPLGSVIFLIWYFIWASAKHSRASCGMGIRVRIPINRGHAFQMWAFAFGIRVNWDVKRVAVIVWSVCWWLQNRPAVSAPELSLDLRKRWYLIPLDSLSIFNSQSQHYSNQTNLEKMNGLLEDTNPFLMSTQTFQFSNLIGRVLFINYNKVIWCLFING